jgi:outer membrane receptor protein involved in Fe transport
MSTVGSSRNFAAQISALILAAGLLAGSAHAQLSTASVTGIVRDPTGGVVAQARVVLRNPGTAVERSTVTNTAGNYVFLAVNPGRYTLETSAPGFKSSAVSEFTLAVNQTATIDVVLEIGALEQTVSVEASAAEIESATAELGAVVAEKQVVDLPLNGRNFTQLLSLSAGVAPVSVSQNATGPFGVAKTEGSQFVFPAINGQTNRSNFFMLDGIDNQGMVSTYVVPPIIDAIQEFKVNSHNDQAEFGSSTGGIVNVVTKSGTNSLHGTAWEYVRNDAFDARNTFQQSVTPFKQNQFGFSLGGPAYIPKLYNGKNKTFFYGAFQQFLYRRPANSFFRVPTEANYNGDLSDIPTQIYNPFTTREDPNHPGSFIRDPFPGNRIPANLIDQGLVAFGRATLPAAGPKLNGENNAIDPTPLHQDQREYQFRVDQNIGQNDSIWFRFSNIDNDTTSSGGRPGLLSTKSNPGRNWAISYVRTFSPSLILQAQYGHVTSSEFSPTIFTNLPADVLAAVNFSPAFAGNFIGGLTVVPAVNVDNFFSGGESQGSNPIVANTHQFKANVTKITGTHTLKWGGNYSSMGQEAFNRSSDVTFSAQQTGNPSNSAEPGSSLASFLLNVPDHAGRRNVHETVRPGGVMSFFFQDSWKATSKLTVNLGLRYDRTFQPPYGRPETVGQNGGIETGSIDFNDGTYVVQQLPPPCSERGHAPCIPGDGTLPEHVRVDPRGKIYHDTTTNWGPRVGLAYRLGQNTAIRSGFGIVYDNWAAVTQTAQNYEGAWPDIGQQLANNLNVPKPGQVLPNVRGQDPFATGGSLLPPLTPFEQVQWFMDPYAKNPYSLQWNFGIEHQLTTATTLSLNYVGSGSRRMDVGGYYNVALTPGPGDPRQRALYPYIGPTYYDRSIGKADYNAFQFQMNKRFSKGLAYQVAYTWSKSLDYGASGWYGVEGQSVSDPYHLNRDRGPSGFDLTHVLSVNTLYELPVGKGKMLQLNNRVLDYVFGNWQVNSIFLARSGQPYQVYVSGDVANTGNVGWTQYERANLVGGVSPYVDNATRDDGLNRAAFAIPERYTFGNLGRDRLRTLPFWNLDFSVFRQFPILEGRRLEFRAEAFNVVNHPILGQPQNDMADTANFGKILSTANTPRTLQLGAKIIF